MDIKGLRKDYANPVLSRDMLAPDPFNQFARWFEEACAVELPEPNAMTLATVGVDGQPTLRTVLLKIFDRDGFVFFTNYSSRKAREIGKTSTSPCSFPGSNWRVR
jgi:pyridoxamine 5'-phosphate oxidase